MTTITKEWLQRTIAEFENTRDDIPFGLDDDDAKILLVLKRALASLDAEPVRYLNKFSGTCVTLEQQSNAADDVAVYIPLYTAPPAPVVPEEMPAGLAGQIVSLLAHNIGDKFLAQKIWNACRAAMLQAGNHTEQHLDMVDHSGDANEKGSDGTFIDEGTKQAGNSPVILEGWISCSERMPEQDDWVLIYSKHGEYLAGQVQGEYVELNDGTLSWLGAALHWMPLPEPPKQE
ncbi:DUF551 domain-containing protein [Salmonella enterica subsp. enterica]|nr:DUF551 domain-containing protein [Salmonella enterica subsp. enterica serovar Richmond]